MHIFFLFFLRKEEDDIKPRTLQKDPDEKQKLQTGPSGSRRGQRRRRVAGAPLPPLPLTPLDGAAPPQPGSRRAMAPQSLHLGRRTPSRESAPTSTSRSTNGSAIYTDPTRGSTKMTSAPPRSSEEPQQQRGRAPPPTTSSPTAPPPPRRRRRSTHTTQHYVQAEDRGSPRLPPPWRPTETKESRDLPASEVDREEGSKVLPSLL